MISLCISQDKSIPDVVCPVCGCVQGTYMRGYDTEKFQAFLGIPFAKPPINDLRFKSPKPYPKFNGTFDATTAKPDCIQKNYLSPKREVMGEEDCLYLNVYSPILKNNTKKLLPVMVYIFGGGWFSGSSHPVITGPEYIMDTKKVILVTFNYRLGPFGFLSTNDRNMPGNFGLKDQNLALLWVQKNIAAFGGDPTSVTLFGQSAGAVSAHMHMLSKKSQGLFHRIIALSGTANVPFALTEDPLSQARKVAKFCNISEADSIKPSKLTQKLRAIDADTLVNAGDSLKYWDVDPMTSFRPVIEQDKVIDAFFTQHPTKILESGQYKPVPWLAGFVPKEGAVRGVGILENDKLKSSFNNDFDKLLEKLLDLPQNFTRNYTNSVMSFIIDEYFNGIHSLNDLNGLGLIDIVSDRGFLSPLYNAIDSYVNTIETEKYHVYLYNFNYRGANTFAAFYKGGIPSRDYGAVHCDDLIYLFRSPLLFQADFPKNSTDAAVMRAFVDNFVHFAETGKPRNPEKQRPCNKETFQKNGFCDYQEFVNSKNGSFETRISNHFRVEYVKLWNYILGTPKLQDKSHFEDNFVLVNLFILSTLKINM